MSVPVFRFAPSPNGRLHLGHAYAALLNAKMANETGGRLLLRIEDTDLSRCKPEHTRDILSDLVWLGLAWEEPVRIQSEHFADYDDNLQKLWDMDAIFPCFCSRKEAAARALVAVDPEGQPLYGGTCRSIPKPEAFRRITDRQVHGWRINMTSCDCPEASVWGDVVIAKRQGGSCYHIAVVTDDALQGVSHVVRGMDMEPSTSIHKLLQKLLGLPTPYYHHHRLILDEAGRKLSKCSKSTSLAALRESGVTANELRRQLGFL